MAAPILDLLEVSEDSCWVVSFSAVTLTYHNAWPTGRAYKLQEGFRQAFAKALAGPG